MENNEQQENQSELPKDALIFAKSMSVGKDNKGRPKIDLRFSEEETQVILAEMAKIKSRVKLQIHYTEGKDAYAFMFVKEVQDAPGRGGGFQKAAAKPAVSSATAAKVAALKNSK